LNIVRPVCVPSEGNGRVNALRFSRRQQASARSSAVERIQGICSHDRQLVRFKRGVWELA